MINNKFQIRSYNGSNDKNQLNKIPRTPITYSNNNIFASSHPIDFGLRPTLTQKNYISVVENTENSMAVGAYACNIKEMKVFGKKRTVYYAFDFSVDPKFRNQSISSLFFSDLDRSLAQDTTSSNGAPILFGSSSKINSPIKKGASKINLFNYCDQVQCAWKVEEPFPIRPLDAGIRIWEETDSSKIKMRWDNAFKNFNFTPYDFNDLLKFNRRYHLTTYVATMRRGKKVSEASISVWDQDLIYTLKNENGIQKHRQLFSCYSLGENKDELFQTLLKHVHNEQLKQNVNYLFAGFSFTDPIIKHFPLIKGIKNLEFSAYLKVNSAQEMSVFNEAIEKNVPMFNDPRDYGCTIFYKDIETPKSKL
eukprot:gene10261-12585_t